MSFPKLDMESVKIVTPKKTVLNGLYFGSKLPDKVYIFVHGLGGNLFSNIVLIQELALRKDVGVLTFSNRGSEVISRIQKLDARKKSGFTKFMGGMAFEKFEDCQDDVLGAVKHIYHKFKCNIILVGHSTGCQKIIFSLAKSKQLAKLISHLVLIAPMSDFAYYQKITPINLWQQQITSVKSQIQNNEGDILLKDIQMEGEIYSANRFFSLYSGVSNEEIFTYFDDKIKPVFLEKINLPILIILGEKDEYRSKPMIQIAKWFVKHINTKSKVQIITNVGHKTAGHEKEIIESIQNFEKIK